MKFILNHVWSARTGSSLAAVLVAVTVTFSAVLPSHAEQRVPSQGGELRELKELIARQAQEIEKQRRILDSQQQRLQVLESRVERASRGTVLPARHGPSAPLACKSGKCKVLRVAEKEKNGAEPAKAGTAGAAPRPPSQIDIPSIAETFTGVLTPQGTLVAEPSIEYSTTSLNRVVLEGFTVIPAITVGSIDIREVDRDVITAAATARYGVTDRIELDVKVPFVRRMDSTTTRPVGTGASSDVTTDVSGDGLGDVEVSGHYQINRGTEGWPIIVANTRVKTPTGTDPFEVSLDANGLERELPTGTGFWGVEPSISVLFPSDPAVFFGTVGYLFNLPRTVTLQTTGLSTRIDPGDAFRFSFGMGMSVNERSSFSLGYEHSFVFDSEQNGLPIANSNLQVGSFLLGWAYRVNKSTSINLAVGIGATREAPDARVLLRVPVSFDLFSGGK